MTIDPRTPVVVAVGQHTQHQLPAELPEGRAPSAVDLMAEAARAALADSGVEPGGLAAALDGLVAVRTFPDSTVRPLPEKRATNPPRSVARRIGADPRWAAYTTAGGDVPQRVLGELAGRIAAGELDSALLVGGEILATAKHAARLGVELDHSEDVPGQLEDRGFGTLWLDKSDIQQRLYRPIDIYPLFETAIRARRGVSVERHLRSMGELFEPFCEVAVTNRYTYRSRLLSAERIADPSGRNGFIGHPYTRAMNARDTVDMAAAVIVTSVEKARALAVAEDRWVYLHGCGALRDALYLRDRRDFHSSPAIERLGERVLGASGVGIDDVEHIDLYSCFPSAVEIACEALGLREDDQRGLTLTGGLPFFGGPGNDYSLHAIAEAVGRCRLSPGSYALVSANGGSVTKHAIGVYSTRPRQGAWKLLDLAEDQREIDTIAGPPTVDAPESGRAELETCTVVHSEGQPVSGFVIARKAEGADRGARFIGRVPADGGLEELMGDDAVGLECRVEVDGEGMNVVRIGRG